MADDLNDLLDHLEPGPFILAAHSGGGPIVRAAAADRPDRIAGLVLVDVTDEGCEVLFEPGFRRLERTAHLASVALARIGLLARLYGPGIRLLPPDAQADVRREGFTARAMRTRGEELRALVAATNRLRDHPLATPDIPTVAISGARCDGGMSARVRAAANAAHARRAGLASRGRHVVAQRSGHMVPLTEPGLVADEIIGLLPLPGR
jgi:pimeloyl-ACP methyl ester carboxylesterase